MNKIKAVVLVLITSILTIIPFYNLIIAGVYQWHVRQPEFIEGGIELIILAVALIVAWYLLNKKRFVLPALFLTSIYLSSNGVIIPVVVVCIYFLIIVGIGYLFQKNESSEALNLIIFKSFVLGTSIWGCSAILCSLIGLGTINDLRIMTLVLFSVAVVYSGRYRKKISFIKEFERIVNWENESLIEIALISIIIIIIAGLCVKTNTAQDYDSLWYGLRSQYVLVGENSFYDNLGYLTYVYYYPKFSELLLLPLSDLGDYSFIQCSNILLFMVTIFALYEYVKNNVLKENKKLQLAIVVSIASIPAFANISATAKGDILGFLFVFLAFVFFDEYRRNNNEQLIAYALCSLFLCTTTRLTYLLWGGILFLWILGCILIQRFKNNKTIGVIRLFNNNIFLAINTIITVVGVHYRTYKLTGYVIYPTAVGVWNRVFNSAHKYFLTESNPSRNYNIMPRYLFERLRQFIFDPQQLDHVIMLWISNLLLIAIIIFFISKKKIIDKYDMTLAVIYVLVCMYYMVYMENPDGNYFIIPLIVATLIILKAVIIDEGLMRIYIGIVLSMFIVFLLPITFVSHPSWAWGTNTFSEEVIVNNFETKEKNQNLFMYNGISQIANVVRTFSVNDKVIAYGDSDGTFYRLPCNLETYIELSYSAFSNALVYEYNNFCRVMKDLNTKAFIVSKDDISDYAIYVKRYIEENGYAYEIDDESAIMYVLH